MRPQGDHNGSRRFLHFCSVAAPVPSFASSRPLFGIRFATTGLCATEGAQVLSQCRQPSSIGSSQAAAALSSVSATGYTAPGHRERQTLPDTGCRLGRLPP